MSDPALAIQNAMETALRASAALKTAMGLANVRLYKVTAPAAAPFPYLIIGQDQIIDDSTECAESSEVYTTVHVYTRDDADPEASRDQAKSIAGVVRTIIKALSGVTGFVVVLSEFESTRHLTDPDGKTCHAVVTHRLLLDPA